SGLDIISPNVGQFSGVAVIAGGFIFGLGIIMAAGCASGTWQRAGEGALTGWIALVTFMLMSAMMRTGPLGEFSSWVQGIHWGTSNSISQATGIPQLVLATVFTAVVLVLVVKELKKPKFKVPRPKPKKKGIDHILFEKRWHPFITAILIGVIGTIAWPLSAATGRNAGLGITTPSANILQFLVTGDMAFINWGVFLVVGIMLGSFISSKRSNEFKVRIPDPKQAINSAVGGLVMGFGASLGAGCNIGTALVQTAQFSFQGWVGFLFIMFGVWTGSYFVYILPKQRQSRKIDLQLSQN
ncbi:MAG: YeeE/YedE family protein, partial [Turicibacter sp.]|nr:YeeE/YedE family protein [Turicibacter sp.]